jgi:hypothetical protein
MSVATTWGLICQIRVTVPSAVAIVLSEAL